MDLHEPEAFWAELLSSRPRSIRRAVERLDPAARASVLDHLRRMASEPGWQPAQAANARAALAALGADEGQPSGRGSSPRGAKE